MIAVIADDFTGAAEIGGIALHYGLQVRVLCNKVERVDTDVLIIATNTRSMSAKDATVLVSTITMELVALEPVMIYKKLDSVLRGNVYAELVAQMEAMGVGKSLVVAGNPHLNRTIKDGLYYVGGVALGETGFSKDPTFPAKSSSVIDLVKGDDKVEVLSQNPKEALPEKGLVLGDVENDMDMMVWAEKRSVDLLMAGGSGLFDALLSASGMMVSGFEEPKLGVKKLLVLGSLYPKSEDFIKKLDGKGYQFVNMPQPIYQSTDPDGEFMKAWMEEVIQKLKAGNVAITINHSGRDEKTLPSRLEQEMAKLVSGVVKESKIEELLVEGGSTLGAILDWLNIAKLEPVNEFAPGVIRMKPDGDFIFYITSKPGSYVWNEEML